MGVQLVKMFCIVLVGSPRLTLPYRSVAAPPQVNSNTSLYSCKTVLCRWPNVQLISEYYCYLMEMTINPEGSAHYLISCWECAAEVEEDGCWFCSLVG